MKPVLAKSRRHAANQYYVDPMSDQLVVAVRPLTDVAGTGYFSGKPRAFGLLNQDGVRVKPVALRIEPDPTSEVRTETPTQDKFWANKTTAISMLGAWRKLKHPAGC